MWPDFEGQLRRFGVGLSSGGGAAGSVRAALRLCAGARARRAGVLTPKFGTGGSLICGSNLVINPVQRRKVYSKRFGRDVRGRQFFFRSARELFALISRDRMVTWPERKERMDG
jgi:hypothetical protein